MTTDAILWKGMTTLGLLFGLVCVGVCGATIEFEDGGEHFEPMVAMLCPEPGEV